MEKPTDRETFTVLSLNLGKIETCVMCLLLDQRQLVMAAERDIKKDKNHQKAP